MTIDEEIKEIKELTDNISNLSNTFQRYIKYAQDKDILEAHSNNTYQRWSTCFQSFMYSLPEGRQQYLLCEINALFQKEASDYAFVIKKKLEEKSLELRDLTLSIKENENASKTS